MIGKGLGFIQKFLNKKDSRQELTADFHTTIIRVDDNFISSTSIVIDEILKGNIYSLKEVIVAGTAEVSGNVTSRVGSISGRVYGDIISTEYADIKSTAVIRGNIRAKAISIQAGAIINGAIHVEGNIDERDLIEKVENRLPSKSQKEPALISYKLPEEPSSKDLAPKPEMRRAEGGKRSTVATKTKAAKSADTEADKEPITTSSWY